jgi:hypothetical protein
MGYTLKGIGDSVTGKNEIIPTFDAKIFNFYLQVAPGVVASEKNKFAISMIDRGIVIGPGLVQAYGYFGLSDSPAQFNYLIPSSGTQYSKVYAEIDLSARPQNFAVKVTPQSESTVIELQDDNLNDITSGICQIPLYLINIKTDGTITYSDIRPMIEKVAYASHSNNSDMATNSRNIVAGGTIASTVTATTQSQNDNSTKVATTSYVRTAITNVKNITSGVISIPVSYTGVSAQWVKRQVNFVIGRLEFADSNATRYEGTSLKIGVIPSGFRPKTTMKFVIANSNWTNSGAYTCHYATINTDGTIYIAADTISGSGMQAVRSYGYILNFCYEIT